MAAELWRLDRIEGLIEYFDRWTALLEEPFGPSVVKKARRMVERRRRQAQRRAKEADSSGLTAADPSWTSSRPVERRADESLKSLYRKLARRYHPDLASTETERLRFGELMTQINAAYHAGDIERLKELERMAEAEGPLDEGPDKTQEQIDRLTERLAWFQMVEENLKEELAGLRRHPSFELWKRIEAGKQEGIDIYAQLSTELSEQARRGYSDVGKAILRLEEAVTHHNKKDAALSAALAGALAQPFDPQGRPKWIRAGLGALDRSHTSPRAKAEALRLEAWASDQPPLLRLFLLTYASEKGPYPPPGLETHQAITERFGHLNQDVERAPSLEEVLVEASDRIELSPLRASKTRVRLSLRFRREIDRQATLWALRHPGVRRELKRVLEVLGRKVSCPSCKKQVYELPLYRLRGLDNLNAQVCPACAAVIESYWMPAGKNVQSELNDAFVDLKLVSEWSFRLARSTIATQLLPWQEEKLSVGHLKAFFIKEVLERHRLGIDPRHVRVLEANHRLPDGVPLSELRSPWLTVTFDRRSPIGPQEALDLIRHRIRNRFRSGDP